MTGVLITFEGIDGCGKTSVAQEVSSMLEEAGRDVILTQEPTKTWLGESVKRGISEEHPALTEAFLFMADRASHSKSISEWLSDGKLVLCDRYADSTICYQAASLVIEGFEGDPFEWLRRISDAFVLKPTLTLLLDVEPRVALERIQSRERMTKFERLDFLEKVRENFLRLADIEDRIKAIDASGTFDDVVSATEDRILETID
ncbi:MAG: dTMP kinase [Methanobacteriota archaeon]|nr:MAG: dTMP kinase [Euryarchaeota archaeon]